MITLDVLGCSFFNKSLKLHLYLRDLPRKLKMNLTARSRKLEVIIEKNLIIYTFTGSIMKSLQHTPIKMV